MKGSCFVDLEIAEGGDAVCAGLLRQRSPKRRASFLEAQRNARKRDGIAVSVCELDRNRRGDRFGPPAY
jgi:hypothetical protein